MENRYAIVINNYESDGDDILMLTPEQYEFFNGGSITLEQFEDWFELTKYEYILRDLGDAAKEASGVDPWMDKEVWTREQIVEGFNNWEGDDGYYGAGMLSLRLWKTSHALPTDAWVSVTKLVNELVHEYDIKVIELDSSWPL